MAFRKPLLNAANWACMQHTLCNPDLACLLSSLQLLHLYSAQPGHWELWRIGPTLIYPAAAQSGADFILSLFVSVSIESGRSSRTNVLPFFFFKKVFLDLFIYFHLYVFEYFAGVNTCAPKACLLNPLGLGLQIVALWVLGRKPEFFARAQVFLTFEPSLLFCVLLALLACVHVLQCLEQRHRIWFSSGNSEVQPFTGIPQMGKLISQGCARPENWETRSVRLVQVAGEEVSDGQAWWAAWSRPAQTYTVQTPGWEGSVANKESVSPCLTECFPIVSFLIILTSSVWFCNPSSQIHFSTKWQAGLLFFFFLNYSSSVLFWRQEFLYVFLAALEVTL